MVFLEPETFFLYNKREIHKKTSEKYIPLITLKTRFIPENYENFSFLVYCNVEQITKENTDENQSAFTRNQQ